MLAVAVVTVLLAVGSALSAVTVVVVDLRRAQAAADLAALAGATAVGDGADPCGRAAHVARRNGAETVDCVVTGREVTLSVVVRGTGWRGLVADPTARARAGPAEAG